MADYITRDDAKALIKVIDKQSYLIEDAKVFISIKERLQKYIDNPDKKD